MLAPDVMRRMQNNLSFVITESARDSVSKVCWTETLMRNTLVAMKLDRLHNGASIIC